MLTLKQTGGNGTLSLQLVNGVEEVIYTAPSAITTSALDTVSYTVTDQYNDAAASRSIGVQLDAGPSITAVTPAVVEKGQTTEIGTVAPGLAGDMLTLKQTGGNGTLSLQLVNGVEEVIYTAPSQQKQSDRAFLVRFLLKADLPARLLRRPQTSPSPRNGTLSLQLVNGGDARGGRERPDHGDRHRLTGSRGRHADPEADRRQWNTLAAAGQRRRGSDLHRAIGDHHECAGYGLLYGHRPV
jgi:hypothetical protein